MVGWPKPQLHPFAMDGNCCVSITPVHKEGSSDEVPVGGGRKIIWHGISWVWTFSLILFHDSSCISIRVCDKVSIRVWNMAKLEIKCHLAM